MEKIIIGSDHGGFRLKEALKAHLGKKGYAVRDEGTYSDQRCDYPDSAARVASRVSSGSYARGILICKSGIGNSIVANRFPGVRAALCYNVRAARLSREHNDSNILVLGSAFTGQSAAKKIVDAWLASGFAGGRHAARLDKIRRIERKLLNPRSRR